MAHRGEELDWAPLLDALLADRDAGTPVGTIATRFHRGLARAIAEAMQPIARDTGVRRVVLTGGCFQNALLTELAEAELSRAGLVPLLHERVPPNDGGLAVGQLQAISQTAESAGS
jgi:hydrogenase maturation protein HypF